MGKLLVLCHGMEYGTRWSKSIADALGLSKIVYVDSDANTRPTYALDLTVRGSWTILLSNEGRFDAVVAYNCPIFYPNPGTAFGASLARALQEHLASALKPGGVFLTGHSKGRRIKNGVYSDEFRRNWWRLVAVVPDGVKYQGTWTYTTLADSKALGPKLDVYTRTKTVRHKAFPPLDLHSESPEL